ncbi:putative F-box protein At1g49610 [Diospyros lotus]|uniref:putative F-box protein At1g49610 n=1 Tax=Diospyros lotus TaxID=55363 RepID=UPI00225090A3|nr:putative F-box protein At1g49610 [Diospyros lotus]
MDRISDLPDDILHHILSRLSIKEASGTILLSKRWNHVWATLHCLNFGEISDLGRDEKKKLVSFVDQNLMNRREKGISIHRFRMGIWAHQEFPYHADRWIGWLVECNIKELELELASCGFYDLPRTVFAAKSLTVLSLRCCSMRLPCDADRALFPSLQKLCLRHVVVDDRLIRSLSNICPGLEDLKLVTCFGLRSIKIWGLPKLSKLHLELSYPPDFLKPEVEVIGLNNLQSFVYNECHVRCQKVDIVSCRSLKSLSLSFAKISDKWFHDLFPKLHLLETLTLWDCFSLKKIHISSYTLRHLVISGCLKLTKASMDTPNLLSLGYEGLMVPISLNASASLRTDLCLSFINADKHAWDDGIITEFLSVFDRSEVVKIFTRSHELLYEELKARDPPMRWERHCVKDVKFEKLDAAECKRRGGDWLPGFWMTLGL